MGVVGAGKSGGTRSWIGQWSRSVDVYVIDMPMREIDVNDVNDTNGLISYFCDCLDHLNHLNHLN